MTTTGPNTCMNRSASGRSGLAWTFHRGRQPLHELMGARVGTGGRSWSGNHCKSWGCPPQRRQCGHCPGSGTRWPGTKDRRRAGRRKTNRSRPPRRSRPGSAYRRRRGQVQPPDGGRQEAGLSGARRVWRSNLARPGLAVEGPYRQMSPLWGPAGTSGGPGNVLTTSW